MTPPLIGHRSAAPQDPPAKDNRKALGLALLVHLLLLAALVLGVDWHSATPAPMQVELWADGNSPLPSAPPEQPKPKPEQPPPPPEPEPAPPPPPPQEKRQEIQPKEQPDPEIALEAARKKKQEEEEKAREAAEAAKEKARLEEARKQAELKEKKRLEQERQDAEKEAAEKKAKEDAAKKAAADKAAADKAAADKVAADKAAADKKAKDEAAKKAAADKALLDAIRGDALTAAGLPGGTANRNQAGGGTDSGYGAKVRACIYPGVAYSAPARSGSSNPTAEFRVQLSSDGTVKGLTLTRSSGNAVFDRAVETGIRRCNPFPKPSTGRYESLIDVVYKMYD